MSLKLFGKNADGVIESGWFEPEESRKRRLPMDGLLISRILRKKKVEPVVEKPIVKAKKVRKKRIKKSKD